MEEEKSDKEGTAKEEQIKKPSVLSQVLPYLFTAAILAWVFTGLSSSVVDERHVLSGNEWIALEGSGVRIGSIEVMPVEGKTTFCGAPAGELEKACPDGADFELEIDREKGSVRVRRYPGSRIGDGAEVSIDYAKKVRARDMWAMIRSADLRLFLPVMALHCLAFFLADIFSFGMAYRFFNVPGMLFREIAVMRGAPYVIQVGLAALAEALFPLYLLRVKKVPITETLSSNIWTIIIDTAAIFTAITPGVVYNLFVENLVPAVGYEWLVVCIVYWIVLLGNIVFWHTGYGRSVAERIAARRAAREGEGAGGLGGGLQLLRTFSMARWGQYLKVYLTRALLWVSFLTSNYVAMRALGIDPSPALALIAIPLVVMSIFMPIGVGGYGGPQLIAWFLFVKIGAAGTADQVIAYSLLYSTFFLIGRALIGVVLIRDFWKRVFS